MSKLKKCCEFERVWQEQAPDFPHRYKVTCKLCNGFIKWGAKREAKLKMAESKVDFFDAYRKPRPLQF